MKKSIKNHAHIEASMCNAYLSYEMATFVQHYFEPGVQCRSRRPRRFDEVLFDPTKPHRSIFNYPGDVYGTSRVHMMSTNELRVAHTYVLSNCPEVQPWLAHFSSVYINKGDSQDDVDAAIDEHFAIWFRTMVSDIRTLNCIFVGLWS